MGSGREEVTRLWLSAYVEEQQGGEVHWVPLCGVHLVGHGHKGQAGMS